MLDFDQLVEDTTIEPEIVVPDSVSKRVRELFEQGGVWRIPSLPTDEMDRFRKVVTEAAHEVDRTAYVHAVDGDEPNTKKVTVRLRLKGGRKASDEGVEIGRTGSGLSGRAW